MPCIRHENVRHATLLFSAVGGCATKSRENENKRKQKCTAQNVGIKLRTQQRSAQNVERR